MVAIGLSLAVALVLMAVKFYAYWLTRSAAVLSDALESIINVAASSFAMGSIWMAARPPDEDHPYGHGKIEYFSAGFEGALIVLAAFGIFFTGLRQLIAPAPLPNLTEGLWLLAAASAANFLLSCYLLRTGRRTESLALLAEGKHIMTDVVTSLGVVVGMVLVAVTGWLRVDGLVACLVGGHIVVAGTRLIRHAFALLMDASDPELLDRIAGLLDIHAGDCWIDVHKLRAWRAGNLVHIDFHLVLPRHLTLQQAHDHVKKLENLLIEDFNGMASVLIHADPCNDDQCPICGCDNCHQHTHVHTRRRTWDRHQLTRRSKP